MKSLPHGMLGYSVDQSHVVTANLQSTVKYSTPLAAWYLRAFKWLFLLLVTLLVEKGFDSVIAVSSSGNTSMTAAGERVFDFGFQTVGLALLLFVSFLLFVTRYMINTPWRIYARVLPSREVPYTPFQGKKWSISYIQYLRDRGVSAWKSYWNSSPLILSQSELSERFSRASTWDVVISAFYLVVEFFIAYVVLNSIGNISVSFFFLIILLPLLDLFIPLFLNVFFLVITIGILITTFLIWIWNKLRLIGRWVVGLVKLLTAYVKATLLDEDEKMKEPPIRETENSHHRQSGTAEPIESAKETLAQRADQVRDGFRDAKRELENQRKQLVRSELITKTREFVNYWMEPFFRFNWFTVNLLDVIIPIVVLLFISPSTGYNLFSNLIFDLGTIIAKMFSLDFIEINFNATMSALDVIEQSGAGEWPSPLMWSVIIGVFITTIIAYMYNRNDYRDIANLIFLSSGSSPGQVPSQLPRQDRRRTEQHHDDKLSQLASGDSLKLARYRKRRESGEPLAYIEGVVKFFDHRFAIDRRAYVPNPETEQLVKNAIDYINSLASDHLSILDVGTGCGNIAICLAKRFPNAHITAADILPDSLRLARENAALIGCKNITFKETDLLSDVPDALEPDLIVADLPYGSPDYLLKSIKINEFEHMPVIATFTAGLLDAYRRLIEQIKEKGWETTLLMETGVLPESVVREHLPNDLSLNYILLKDYSITKVDFNKDEN